MEYQRVTIIPGHKAGRVVYHVNVEGDPGAAALWVQHGKYSTISQVLGAFSWPLKPAVRDSMILNLQMQKRVSFSLEDAFEVS
jgi:hypothetical protein